MLLGERRWAAHLKGNNALDQISGSVARPESPSA
jgi:hypothetical protein